MRRRTFRVGYRAAASWVVPLLVAGLAGSGTAGLAGASAARGQVVTIGPPAPFAPGSGIWTHLSVSRAPPACGGSMAYDAVAGGVILYTSGSPPSSPNPADPCGGASEAWEFVNSTWSPLPTPNRMPTRSNASLAYDDASGTLLLFGGSAHGTLLNDSWGYRNGGWTNLTQATAPSPREDAALTYDPSTGSLLLFGGYGGTAGHPSALADTWEFHAGTWTAVSSPIAPGPRYLSGFAYDEFDAEAVLIGGTSVSGGPTPVCCGGVTGDWGYQSGGWRNLSSSNVTSARYGVAGAYDPAASSLIFFGGYSGSVRDDTLAFSGGSWRTLIGIPSPSPRFDATATFDTGVGYLVLFGGFNSTAGLNDTWEFGAPLLLPAPTSPPYVLWGTALGVGAVIIVVAVWSATRPRPPKR